MAAEFLRSHGIDLQEEISWVQFNDASVSTAKVPEHEHSSTSSRAHVSCQRLSEIKGIKLANRDPDSRWDISIQGNMVASIKPHNPHSTTSATLPHVLDGRKYILAPSLCHPHIHLDKCFLLFDTKYADLCIEKGDFAEAMSLTTQAKARFTPDDLERRGRWVIEESITAGVTCMRAFVEVDANVKFKCLAAGLMLKQRYQNACEIQICPFAQDPVFSGDHAAEGRKLMEEALQRDGVDVVGSTPYVESNEDRMRSNVDWAIDAAIRSGKHLDLHLDYNLDAEKEPMLYHVVDALHKRQWIRENKNRKIVLGHCTRLTLFSRDEWHDLRTRIGDLPISFVGLPASDMFMMGKPLQDEGGGERVRGTLQIPQMIQEYELEGAVGVNNVGNAFTPQGSCDPLSLASVGVGIYHAGTKRDVKILYECVSTRAKAAIGCGDGTVVEGADCQSADFVMFESEGYSGGRGRKTLQEIVYDPPVRRKVLYQGCVVDSEMD